MASAWPTMVAEELLSYRVKIKMLQLFMGDLRNALIFKCYIIAAKKAQRRHIEGRKNAGMRECIIALMC